MKQLCLKCERNAAVGNLYCQEIYCPAEQSPYLLDYGEFVGDIEIVQPVTVLRSAVVYEARRQERPIFLKIAHPGEANKNRLKREAKFLQQIAGTKLHNKHLPHILPPYSDTSGAEDEQFKDDEVRSSYLYVGKTMLRERLLYYCIFRYEEGVPLRDWLEKHSQPWVNHIGWIMIGLTHAVASLHNRKMYHAALSPDTVLIKFNEINKKTKYRQRMKYQVPQALLLDLGLASTQRTPDLEGEQARYDEFVLPAYRAPELLNEPVELTYATDVYGLGLILYELLEGKPARLYKLRSDQQITETIQRGRALPLSRKEDLRDLAHIATKSLYAEPSARYNDPTEVHKRLLSLVGEIPRPKKGWFSRQNFIRMGIIVLVMAFLLGFLASLYLLLTWFLPDVRFL